MAYETENVASLVTAVQAKCFNFLLSKGVAMPKPFFIDISNLIYIYIYHICTYWSKLWTGHLALHYAMWARSFLLQSHWPLHKLP